MTYRIAYSLGLDAANRQMQRAGRTSWNEDDANLAAHTLNLHSLPVWSIRASARSSAGVPDANPRSPLQGRLIF